MPYSEPVSQNLPKWQIRFEFQFTLPGDPENVLQFGGFFDLPSATDIFSQPVPPQVTDALLQNLVDYFSKMGPLQGVEEVHRSIAGVKIESFMQDVTPTPDEEQLPIPE